MGVNKKICLYLQSQNESFGAGGAASSRCGRIERRDAGVVDRAALEMRCTGNCTGGSNPSLSAERTGQNRTTNGQVPQIQ